MGFHTFIALQQSLPCLVRKQAKITAALMPPDSYSRSHHQSLSRPDSRQLTPPQAPALEQAVLEGSQGLAKTFQRFVVLFKVIMSHTIIM